MKKNKSGFTLIEILAVVAILGLVLGIGMYYFGKYNENSKDKVLALKNNSVLVGAELYVKETSNKVQWNSSPSEGNIQSVYIPIKQLVSKGYLEDDELDTNLANKCVVILKNNNNVYESNVTSCKNEKKMFVEIPKAATYCRSNLKYIGEEQDLVSVVSGANGEFYFLNYKGNNAGEYEVKAVLADKDNYIWQDNTTGDKIIKCSIKKAEPIFRLSSYNVNSIQLGKTYVDLYSGSIDGELQVKSSNPTYVSAKVSKKSILKTETLKSEISVLSTRDVVTNILYTLIPKKAIDKKNYKSVTKTYTIGNVTPISVSVPECNSGLIYTGEELTLINENNAYTLIGNKQIDADTYDVEVNLNYGYSWNDEEKSTKSIVKRCTIKPKSVKKPVCKSNLVYTGKNLTLVDASKVGAYTLTNNIKQDANSYDVTANLSNNYIWSDNTSAPHNLKCTIQRQKISVPECNDNLEYTGNLINLVPVDNTKYTLTGNQYKEAGEHTVTATLKPNYKWDDNSITSKNITCTIKNRITLITLDNQGATTNSNPNSLNVVYNQQVSNLVSIPKKEFVVTFQYTIPGKTLTTTNVNYKHVFKGFYSETGGRGTKYIDENGKGTQIWTSTETTDIWYAHWEKSLISAPNVTSPTGYDKIFWTKKNDSTDTKVTVANLNPTSNLTLYGHILDTTPPECVPVKTANYDEGDRLSLRKLTNWYAGNVVVKYTCSDNGSGCKSQTGDIYNAGFEVTAEGTKTFEASDYSVFDNAGNKTNCPKTTVKIDKTRPTITANTDSVTSSESSAGYQKAIKIKVDDTGSGISKISRSSCADITSSNSNVKKQTCSYSKNDVTYSAINRLKYYLNGNTLTDDNKSIEQSCDMNDTQVTKRTTPNEFRLKLSWTKYQVSIYAQDMAGNFAGKEYKYDGSLSGDYKNGSFSIQKKCWPRPS